MSLELLAQRLRDRSASAAELAADARERAKRHEGLNAFISLFDEDGAGQAAAAQRRLDDGEASSLCGVPIAHKDIYMTAGQRTTCGSNILKDYVAPYESHVTGQLAAAGTVCIGKTNLDEFAMGSTGENSAFGPSYNPWDKKRVPGGSSSGSAVAVAARIVPAATGTDTGGSVRMPAAYCGICGIKPTYGLLSRRGIVAYASSLDQAGVFATSARDLRAMLGAMTGHDPRDSTSLTDTVPLDTPFDGEQMKGLKIGVDRSALTEGFSDQMHEPFDNALKQLNSLGAEIVDISMEDLRAALSCYYIIACAEASSNLARYDGMLYGSRSEGGDLLETVDRTRTSGFGGEVQRRILLGNFVLSHGYVDEYYRKALRGRAAVIRSFATAFGQCDLIATPATPTTAPEIGAFEGDPVHMYLQDLFTAPVNIAGLPAITAPCGMAEGLPTGFQLIGPRLSERLLLGAIESYQQATDHHEQLPPGVEGWQ